MFRKEEKNAYMLLSDLETAAFSVQPNANHFVALS